MSGVAPALEKGDKGVLVRTIIDPVNFTRQLGKCKKKKKMKGRKKRTMVKSSKGGEKQGEVQKQGENQRETEREGGGAELWRTDSGQYSQYILQLLGSNGGAALMEIVATARRTFGGDFVQIGYKMAGWRWQ